MWRPAFVSERVKGFWSAVGGEWRMGLFCAPLLSRGPGGQGSAGKGFVMSQGCSGWAALLFSLPAHNPFHWISPSVDLSSRALLLRKGQFVTWMNGPAIPINSVDLFGTCSNSGSIFLLVLGLRHPFQQLLDYRGCQLAHIFLTIMQNKYCVLCYLNLLPLQHLI